MSHNMLARNLFSWKGSRTVCVVNVDGGRTRIDRGSAEFQPPDNYSLGESAPVRTGKSSVELLLWVGYLYPSDKPEPLTRIVGVICWTHSREMHSLHTELVLFGPRHLEHWQRPHTDRTNFCVHYYYYFRWVFANKIAYDIWKRNVSRTKFCHG